MNRKATERMYGCMQEGMMPKVWMMGLIGSIWKRKGGVHDPGKYRGVTLLSQVLKRLESVLDTSFRRRVEGDFWEEQQEFRKGRETAQDVRPEADDSGVRRPGKSY